MIAVGWAESRPRKGSATVHLVVQSVMQGQRPACSAAIKLHDKPVDDRPTGTLCRRCAYLAPLYGRPL